MKRHLLIAVIFLAGNSFPMVSQADDAAGRLKRDKGSLAAVTRIVDRYCVDCHDGAEPAAGLNLRESGTGAVPGTEQWDTDTWEKIVKRLIARQMPPADVERPSESEYATVLTAMEAALTRVPDEQLANLPPSEAWAKGYIRNAPRIWYDALFDATPLFEGVEANMDMLNHVWGESVFSNTSL